MGKARLNLKVRGLVQGVSFRGGSRQKAIALGLCGWVRNTDDGGVECVVEGEEDDLEKFLKWCEDGPSFAKVSRVDFEWMESSGEFGDFKIIV